MVLENHYSQIEIIEAGCDEAGRGCLAGPLFAAAVVFPYHYENEYLTDSKKLSKKKREALREVIIKDAVSYSVVSISETIIDEINILNASFKGMNEAIKKLKVLPDLLLIDGNRFKNETEIPYRCIVKGDAKFLSIAAASILAKTFRDDFMESLDVEFPQYDWKQNKGYPTLQHQVLLLRHGCSPYHRKSFHVKGQLRLGF